MKRITRTVEAPPLSALLARWAALAAITLLAVPAVAVLPEPDHSIYGTPRIDGVVATEGTVRLEVDGDTLATYELGADPQLGACDSSSCFFVLRVAMDFGGEGEPRLPGAARPGDEALVYLDGVLAGEAQIGAAGAAQLLDVDSSFLPQVPSLSVVDTAGSESLAGPFGLSVPVTLRLSFPADAPVTVAWQTADGTATAGLDYEARSGVATFAAGATVATITVKVLDDADPEADPALQIAGETFSIVLSQPTEAALLDAVGTVTILDDDTPPALRATNLSVVEPPSGAVDAAFTVSLSYPWTDDVSFDYAGLAGSAGADDFELVAGSATIPAGGLSIQVPVRVLADAVAEGDETFSLQLSSPVGASLRAGGGRGTILSAARVLTFVERQKDGESGADGLFSAIDVALSPDGAHLYAAGRGDDALTVFAREPGTGRLSLVAAYRDGEGGLESLGGVEAVAVSPDGGRVYAAAFDDDALAVFERDPVAGTLTLVEVEREGRRDIETGDTVEGLDGAVALLVLPSDVAGSEHVYVAGSEGAALSFFARDAGSGLLRYEQAYKDGESGVAGLGQAVALAASPDGDQLYVASLSDDSVAVFDRDAATGLLTFVEQHVDGVAGVDGTGGAAAVAVSPDGTSVYVAGQADGAVAVFDRAPNGLLSFREAQLQGIGGVTGLLLATDVAVSTDGAYVYATGFGQDSLVVFERASDGSLTALEVERDGVGGVDGLDGATSLAVSSDDAHVYATGTLDNAVALFRRDLVAPSSPDVLASTSHAVGIYSPNPVIDLQWSGAADDDTGSGVSGYWLLLDGSAGTVPTPGDGAFLSHGLDAHSAASDPQPDGERWAHLLTCDHAGNCAAAHAGPYFVDTTAPMGTVAASTSHQPSTWNHETTITVEWSGATDVNGVAGYSYLFDTAAASEPDQILEQPHGSDPHSAASGALADGDGYYFHLRACDVLGNCGAAIHLGPYWIETVAPTPVTGLQSTSHPIDDTSTVQIIDIVWNASTDATSGLAGYAVEFDANPTWVCDQVVDVAAGTIETSSTVLDDGTWYAHVCAGDEAGNWTAAASSGPYAISTAPATVTRVASVADTGDGQLAAGEATQVPITQLYVDFSRPMSDPGGNNAPVDVTNPDSWRLVGAGADGVLDTTDCSAIDPADVSFAIDHVDYAAIPRRADLWLDGPVALPAGLYRLIACAAGLHDQLDGPLDGDGDGTGGDDFRLDFAVRLTNRLHNPNFDIDLAGWIQISEPGQIVHDDQDADDLATSGSARIATIGAPAAFALAQCLPVEETHVQVAALTRVESLGPVHPVVSARAEFFTSSTCTGSPFETLADSLSADTAGQWLPLTATGAVPDTATSVLVSFAVVAQATEDFEVHFDVLSFGSLETIFADGFESGDTSGWSIVVP